MALIKKIKNWLPVFFITCVSLFVLFSCDGYFGMDILVIEPEKTSSVDYYSRIFQVESDKENAEQELANFIPGKPIKDAEIEVLVDSVGGNLSRFCLLQTNEKGTCSFGHMFTPKEYNVVIKVKKDGFIPAEIKYLHDSAKINSIIILLVRSSFDDYLPKLP